MPEHDLARRLRNAAAIAGGPAITPSQFARLSPPRSPDDLTRLLANWPELRAAAGLPESAPRAGHKRYSRDDLLVEYDRVCRKLGKEPTWAELNRHASIARQTYQDRIGNKNDLRRAYAEWRALRDKAAGGDPDAQKHVRTAALENRTIEPDHINGFPHDPLDVTELLPPAGYEPKPLDPRTPPLRRPPLRHPPLFD